MNGHEIGGTICEQGRMSALSPVFIDRWTDRHWNIAHDIGRFVNFLHDLMKSEFEARFTDKIVKCV